MIVCTCDDVCYCAVLWHDNKYLFIFSISKNICFCFLFYKKRECEGTISIKKKVVGNMIEKQNYVQISFKLFERNDVTIGRNKQLLLL